MSQLFWIFIVLLLFCSSVTGLTLFNLSNLVYFVIMESERASGRIS